MALEGFLLYLRMGDARIVVQGRREGGRGILRMICGGEVSFPFVFNFSDTMGFKGGFALEVWDSFCSNMRARIAAWILNERMKGGKKGEKAKALAAGLIATLYESQELSSHDGISVPALFHTHVLHLMR
jgi:hypothetical protein